MAVRNLRFRNFFGKENLASIFLGGLRWYDEETNTNIEFLMFLFFAVYHLMPSGKFLGSEILHVGFLVQGIFGSGIFVGFCWEP